MKKTLLLLTFVASVFSLSARDYILDPTDVYAKIVDGTITSVVAGGGPKYELNNNVTTGEIFTIWSPDSRRMRIDIQDPAALFPDGTTATNRLEPNGASNSTNGRKIYIDCPEAGTLTVYSWTTSSGRGYTVESASSVGGNSTGTISDVYAGTKGGVAVMPAKYDGSVLGATSIQTFQITAKGVVALNPDAGFYYGKVKFTTTSTAIGSVETTKEVSSVKYYDLTGKQVPVETKGFVITKTTYEDGSVDTTKSIVR